MTNGAELEISYTFGYKISVLTQYLPLGDTIGQLSALSYVRYLERQADNLGRSLIVTTGYGAAGLRNSSFPIVATTVTDYERVAGYVEIQEWGKSYSKRKKQERKKNSVFDESKTRIIRHLNYQFPTYFYWRMIYVITTASIDIFGQSWLIFVSGQFRSNGAI